MAFRTLLKQRLAVPIAAGSLLAGSALLPIRPVHAEEPATTEAPRKPIYDDPTPPTPTSSSSDSSKSSTTTIAVFHDDATLPAASKPTPTDRLASQIRRGRLQLYKVSVQAEDAVNRGMTQVLKTESNVAQTIASLAPPKTSNEQLVPGLVYVLVATLAGSIVTRRRNILLRATVPVLFGIATGWAVIPLTMRNLSDLTWKYEQRFPAVADAHLKLRQQAQYIWDTGKAHSAMTLQKAEDAVQDAKDKVQDWVKEGK